MSSSLRLLLALTIISLVVTTPVQAALPRVEDIEQSLEHDRSYKVRVNAALILGRIKERRSIPTLITALKDAHPAVRATAAQALGRIADPVAHDALVRAQHDPNRFVRRMAGESLRSLQAATGTDPVRRRLAFEIKPMGDRSRKATPALRGRMRDFLTAQLRAVGDLSLDKQQPGFVVDGVIKELSMTMGATMVEIACSVQLVVSRHPGGGVFLLTSGEALVQRPIRQYKPHQRASMEIEALENAVRGASDDLLQSLGRQ